MFELSGYSNKTIRGRCGRRLPEKLQATLAVDGELQTMPLSDVGKHIWGERL